MKSIRFKLMSIFVLVFTAMFVVVVSSYIAIDTQKQHLVLTELLSKQKLLVERATYTTINSGEVALYNTSRFMETKDDNLKSIKTYVSSVDFMFNAFESRIYPLDGTNVKLKFNEAFSQVFDQGLVRSVASWEKAKADIDWLFDSNNLKDIVTYEERLDAFKVNNAELIAASDNITHICRIEANRKKDLSESLQYYSVGLTLIIFLLLVWIIKRDIQDPIMSISNVFKKMGNGDFNVKLHRKNEDEFKSLYEDFNRFIESYNIIRNIENRILEVDGLNQILGYMKESFKSFIPLRSISIFYHNAIEGAMKYSTDTGKSVHIDGFEKVEDICKVNDNTILVPIMVNNLNVGYTEFITETELTDRNFAFIKGLKEKIGFALYKTLLFKDLLGIVTNALSDIAEERDPETRRHLFRMSYYSRVIAEELKNTSKYKDVIDDNFLENIVLTSPMHDIGKVSVPDNILLKPGKLTDEEFVIMKTHCYKGAVVLAKIHESFKIYGLEYFKMAENIANYHQEKFDGSGYPEQIKGDNIPLPARISALADVFDALTSKRPYKEAFSLEKSYEIINQSKGSHFDPEIVDAFYKAQDRIEEIYNIYKEV
jgi:HD-GYP domain-containing protein (c-di-GMP phosphodiesterase class II)